MAPTDFEDKVLLSLIAFLLTSFLGALVGFALNRQIWKTQAKYAAYKALVDEGSKFLDEVAELIGRRFS